MLGRVMFVVRDLKVGSDDDSLNKCRSKRSQLFALEDDSNVMRRVN